MHAFHPCRTGCNKGLVHLQISRWPMGRLFGGTARLNNMVHVRGHEQDYDDWYKQQTNYNYKTDILDYFQRLESRKITYRSKITYIA